MLGVALTSCLTLGKLLNLPGPWFLPLQNGDGHNPYYMGLSVESGELMLLKSKYIVNKVLAIIILENNITTQTLQKISPEACPHPPP